MFTPFIQITMSSRIITFLLLLFCAMPLCARANDTLRFAAVNLPVTDHYSYLNNMDSGSSTYDTLFSKDFSIIFDSVAHFVDTTVYSVKDVPQAQLQIVFDKIANHISYIHFTSGPIIGTKTVTFELKNVISDFSLPPTHFQLHGDSLAGHDLLFSAQYHFFTSGGYIDNNYSSTGQHRDSSYFSFSLTPEVPTAGIEKTIVQNLPIIYPNPASSVLHVQFPEHNHGSVSIYDATGKRVLIHSENEGVTDVNVSSLPSGIYMMRVGSLSKELVISH